MDYPVGKVIDTNALASSFDVRGAKLTADQSAVAPAPAVYAATFSQGQNQDFVFQTPDWNAFVEKNDELLAEKFVNWSLVSINTSVDNMSTSWYTGVWNRSLRRGNILRRFTDWDSFKGRFDRAKEDHKRLLDFNIQPSQGTRYYTGTWGDSPNERRFVHGVDWTEFKKQWSTLSAGNWRLTKIQLYPASAQKTRHATGLFEKGVGDSWDKMTGYYNLVSETDWNSFYKKHQEIVKQGGPGRFRRLRDFQVYDDYQMGKRYYVGVYIETVFPCQAVLGENWASLTNLITTKFFSESMEVSAISRYPIKIQSPQPQPTWKSTFQTELSNYYGYCGWQLHRNLEAVYPVGLARAKQDWPPHDTKIDGSRPPEAFTFDTRFNFASVSKPVTAIALLHLFQEKKKETHDAKFSIDTPFYEFVKHEFEKAKYKDFPKGPGVEKVTIRNLLQHKSGMTEENELAFSDIWTFLAAYFKKQNVREVDRGFNYVYSNTNFTILQAVIDCVTGHSGEWPDHYTEYVSENILKTMDVNPQIFNPFPEPLQDCVLYYGNRSVTKNHGIRFGWFTGVAAGGWVTSGRELAKFVTLTTGRVLDNTTRELMFSENLGWFTHEGLFGQYFYHDGGFGGGGTEKGYGLSTCIMVYPDQSCALLLVNAEGLDLIGTLVRAYEGTTVK